MGKGNRLVPSYFSLAAAILMASNGCDALVFQAAPTSSVAGKLARTGESRTTQHKMAETSYPFGNQGRTTSFLSIFQNTDWSGRSRQRRRELLSPSLILGSSGGFSFLEESNVYDDDDLLKYLPSKGTDLMPPKTEDLLKRLTSQYVTGREPVVKSEEVLDVIDEEYKSRDVPVRVGNLTFDFTSSGEIEDSDVARILSFAASHRLPSDVALLLLGTDEEDNTLTRYREAFACGGWEDVSFPKGLAVKPKRKFVKSTTERYMPLPRGWATSRKEAARLARVAVDEATGVVPPVRRLLSREEFLATMDEELSSSEPLNLLPTLFRDARLFFPRQNLRLKRLRRVLKKQSLLLKHAGFAGLISYVALNFAWYTFAIALKWRGTSSTVEISSRALSTSLRRFGKVLAAVYIGSQLTRVLRLKIALVLAPFGQRALRLTQQKLQVSENRAFALLAGAVVGSCLAVWSIIVLGDAAVLRALVMPRTSRPSLVTSP